MLTPSQRCKFLGFIFDSIDMSLKLPDEKVRRSQALIKKFKSLRCCTIRDFAAFIGILDAHCPSMIYGGVYTKSFEREQLRALEANNGDDDAQMTVAPDLQEDFVWSESHIVKANAPLSKRAYEMEIFSDASRSR